MKYITADVLKNMLKAANNYLKLNIKKVNLLNVFPVPDGDTGTNMSATMDAAIKEINGKHFKSVGELSNAASFGSLKGARGNSGVILSQLLRGFAKELKDKDVIDVNLFVNALKSAANSAYRAVMKPTEGTILTVARGIADDAKRAVEENNISEIEELIEICVLSGKKWLDKTPDMLPILKEANVVDAGGMGLLIIFEGIYRYILDGTMFDQDVTEDQTEATIEYKPEEIKFTYCTEFFITGLKKNIEDEFKEYLSFMGDSIIVIQEGDILKTHVHTNSPGKVIEKAIKYGELINIKIDNMKYQHQEFIKPNVMPETSSSDEGLNSEYGFIAVSQGEGFYEILKGLGVNYIIEGGQTMNPSTEDFINAIKSVDAKNIFIFPNNKNVIMAAEQSVQMLTTKKNIIVMKTKNIPECIAALIRFDMNADVNTNIKKMENAIESIKTVEITHAIKDTKINGFSIYENDFIGIFNKEIIGVGKNLFDVANSCIKKIVDDQTQLISIYYGKKVSENEIENFIENLKEKYDVDIEGYKSGNDIYHLIIVAEK